MLDVWLSGLFIDGSATFLFTCSILDFRSCFTSSLQRRALHEWDAYAFRRGLPSARVEVWVLTAAVLSAVVRRYYHGSFFFLKLKLRYLLTEYSTEALNKTLNDTWNKQGKINYEYSSSIKEKVAVSLLKAKQCREGWRIIIVILPFCSVLCCIACIQRLEVRARNILWKGKKL